MRIDEEIEVFGLGFGVIRIWWFVGCDGWLLFLMGGLGLGWSLELVWF